MSVLRAQWRMLTLRMRQEDADALTGRHLAFGLAITLLTGIGRSWDDPDASALRHSGIGSVAYVVALAGMLWASIRLLEPRLHAYRLMLTAVTLTALPGLLYAIPVERWTDLATAQRLNVGFLAVVAAWRVAAWLAFLIRARILPWWAACTATLLPLGAIVAVLAILNLERAAFSLMAGLREPGGPNDKAYVIVLGLAFRAVQLSPLLVVAWAIAAVIRHRQARRRAI